MHKGQWALILILYLLCTVGCGGSETDEQDVRRAFDTYCQAVQERDGGTAADLVTESTIEYYQKVVDMSLDYDEQRTKALPLTDKVMVIMSRHRIDPESLRSMRGRDLFSHGVNHGWVGDDGMNRIASGDIEFQFRVDGDKAWMTAVDPKSGAVSDNKFRFVQESGAWKIDLISALKEAQPMMRTQIMRSGLRENQFVEMVAGIDSDKQVDETVWQPIGR